MRHVVHDVSAIVTWTSWGCVALVWALGLLQQRWVHSTGDDGEGRDLASWAGVAAAALAFALPAALWRSLRVSSPWLQIAGAVVVIPAAGAAIWSRLALGTMWSSAARATHRHQLRTEGPYAVTRHPIYSAIIALLVGTALTQGLGRWTLLLVAITLILKSKVAAEERLLTRRFPEQYARYRERVPQLVPRLLPRAGGGDRSR